MSVRVLGSCFVTVCFLNGLISRFRSLESSWRLLYSGYNALDILCSPLVGLEWFCWWLFW